MRQVLIAFAAIVAVFLFNIAPSLAQNIVVDGPGTRGGQYPTATGDRFTCELQAGRRYLVSFGEVTGWSFGPIYPDVEVRDPAGIFVGRFVYPFLSIGREFELTAQSNGPYTLAVRTEYPDEPGYEVLTSYVVYISELGTSTDIVPGAPGPANIEPNGLPVNGMIDHPGDHDTFVLNLQTDRAYSVTLRTPAENSGMLGSIGFDLYGAVNMAYFDPANADHPGPSLIFRTKSTPSQYVFQVQGVSPAPYEVVVQPLEPSIPVALANSAANAIPITVDDVTPLVYFNTEFSRFYFRTHLHANTAYTWVPQPDLGVSSATVAILSPNGSDLIDRSEFTRYYSPPPFVVPNEGDYLIEVAMNSGAARFRLVESGPSPAVHLATPASADTIPCDGSLVLIDSAELPERAFFRLTVPAHTVAALEVAVLEPCGAFPSSSMGWHTRSYGSNYSYFEPINLSPFVSDHRAARGIILATFEDQPEPRYISIPHSLVLGSCDHSTLSLRLTPLATGEQARGLSFSDPLPLAALGTSPWIMQPSPGAAGARWLSMPVIAGRRYTLAPAGQSYPGSPLRFTVFDADGNNIADRFREVSFVAPTTGTTLIRIGDAWTSRELAAQAAFAIAATDNGPATDDHANTDFHATPITASSWMTGILEVPGDVDCFSIDLRAGTQVTATLESQLDFDIGLGLSVGLSTHGSTPGSPYAYASTISQYSDSAGLQFRASVTGRYNVFVNQYYRNTFPPSPPVTGPVPYRIRIDSAGCASDLASIGGDLTPDGQLTIDDVIAFLNAYLSGDLQHADRASIGGGCAPDGYLTVDDLIVFFAGFFDCPRL